jgi:hypothetical protein
MLKYWRTAGVVLLVLLLVPLPEPPGTAADLTAEPAPAYRTILETHNLILVDDRANYAAVLEALTSGR